jgi:outer membrane protein OmpA-like peptidoglycan-associated protein
MRMMLKQVALVGVVALVASACATRGFARREAAAVDAKVDTLAATVEETQERTLQNGEQISVVDQRAQAAGQAAEMGQQAADAAAQAAEAVNMRVDGVEAEARRFMFEVTLNEAQGGFELGRAGLPDAARARVDQLVGQIQADPQNVYFEIEGHTDATGSERRNIQLGMQRADTVKMYLYDQHNVPLHRISVLSFGEDRPAAPNDTPEGRAQNRRVVIRVRS